MDSRFEDNALWAFSLRVYGAAEVAPACLRLQERHGVDVNVLLFAAWLGVGGRSLDPPALDRVLDHVGPWHETVVRHVRALRVALRPGFEPADGDQVEALRRRLQKVEIDAEFVEQEMLYGWAADNEPAVAGPTGADGALTNMAGYVERVAAALSTEDRADLAHIAAAAAAGDRG